MNGIQSMLPGVVGPLSSMGVESLKQLFARAMSPGGASMGVPPLEILGAIEKASQAQKLRQAQAGGMAQMQANQPTVRDEVLGQAYAGGGIVAFANGTGPDGLPQQSAEEDISDDPSLSLAERWRRSQKRAELSRQQGIGRSYAERFPAPQESTTDTGDEAGRLLRRGRPDLSMPPAINVPFGRGMAAERKPSGVASLVSSRQPAASAPAAPSLVTTATPANLTPEMANAMQEQEERLRGRLTRPESLTKAEEGLAALAKANIEAQQAEAKTYGEEIRAARDAALAKAQRDITSDPMSLLALAGSIDTRKGQGVGSLARGAAGLMGEREKQAEAARKEFALAQRDERAMQANIRQTQMLEAQRQVALQQGHLNEVNAINDQLSKLAIDREQFRLTRGDVAFQQAMKSREVAAEEEKARAAKISAGKPTELEQRIRLFQQNPEQYRTMFGIDPKETSVELRALKDEEQQLLKRLETTMLPEAKKPIEARLDDIIKMRRTLMGAAPVSAPAGTSRPTSKAEFDALPKGTRYINPADGKEYIKN